VTCIIVELNALWWKGFCMGSKTEIDDVVTSISEFVGEEIERLTAYDIDMQIIMKEGPINSSTYHAFLQTDDDVITDEKARAMGYNISLIRERVDAAMRQVIRELRSA